MKLLWNLYCGILMALTIGSPIICALCFLYLVVKFMIEN